MSPSVNRDHGGEAFGVRREEALREAIRRNAEDLDPYDPAASWVDVAAGFIGFCLMALTVLYLLLR